MEKRRAERFRIYNEKQFDREGAPSRDVFLTYALFDLHGYEVFVLLQTRDVTVNVITFPKLLCVKTPLYFEGPHGLNCFSLGVMGILSRLFVLWNFSVQIEVE